MWAAAAIRTVGVTGGTRSAKGVDVAPSLVDEKFEFGRPFQSQAWYLGKP